MVSDQPDEIVDMLDVLSDHGFLVSYYESEVEFGRQGFVINNARIQYSESHDDRDEEPATKKEVEEALEEFERQIESAVGDAR